MKAGLDPKICPKICLVGATGRMGVEIRESVDRLRSSGVEASIVCGIVDAGSSEIGKQVSGVELPIAAEWREEFKASNVIIDFSSANGAVLALDIAAKQGLPLVSCSTGVDAEFDSRLTKAAKKIAILRASNTSIGITAMLELVRNATALLGDGWDIELLDIHHKMKKDAPSGTAISLLGEIAKLRDVKLEGVLHEGRKGVGLRKEGELGVAALRAGDVAGEHTVFFFGDGERIEITHRATKRSIFADGAIRAAGWLLNSNRKAGQYSMRDVLPPD